MKILILLFIVLSGICPNFLSQQNMVSYKDYLSAKKTLSQMDNLIEKGHYSRAIKKSEKLKELPFGLRKSFYVNLGECYFNLGNLQKARQCFIESSRSGLIKKYFEVFKNNHSGIEFNDVDFADLIESDYDSIVNSRMDSNYINLESEILHMINLDQEIRRIYANQIKSATLEVRDSLLNKMKFIDSINQRSYDSIATKYGWISRDMILNHFRNPHIVLYHSTKDSHYKYIEKGYKLASNNLIDWYDVIALQAYAIGRDANINRNSISSIPSLDFNSFKINPDKYYFVCSALAMELTDGGSFSESGKKIQIFISGEKSIENHHYLKKIKKDLIKMGVEKDKIVLSMDDWHYVDSGNGTHLGIKIL